MVNWSNMKKYQNNTRELQVARKISDLLSDLRLDIDIVAVYMADMIGTLTLNRAIALVESAEALKEQDGIEVIRY
jgi:hypothetical protein